MKFKCRALAVGAALAALSAPLAAQDAQTEDRLDEWQGEARDAWIDGKLEASYLINTELNNFDIVTRVDNGSVVLSGEVANETKKQLAGEIAQNLDGVVSVDNQLVVRPAAEDAGEVAGTDDETTGERNFSTRFYDLTTTARLKSSYAINDQLEALAINIDTRDGVVTLEGEVSSDAQKQLAEEIARGYDHVVRVENNLVVSAEESVAEEGAEVDDPRV